MGNILFFLYWLLTTPLVLAGNGVLWVLGYDVTSNATVVAESLVPRKADASDCSHIYFFSNIMGPTVGEVRSSCIHEYAKLTQNPSACELLLPGEYGLSCINDVVAQEYKDHPDAGFFDFKECSKVQQDPLREDWCNFVRAHRSRKTADCSPIHNDVIRAGCRVKFEAWEKYPSLRRSFYFGKSSSPEAAQ